ncbi:MAG: PstS family phosphate ABC transporter substrate-binding protein [Candidatus Margulisbacteria bacterium]|nr:PstS family phosphate ABC transporter substrate-binding protein [Candidatus Margulisiibacteriota bacterium]
MRKILIRWVGLVMFGGILLANTPIQIKGSDTMVNLVQKLAEVYMQQNTKVSISVIGGGSGTGISALINQKTDICNSSRLIQPKELAQCKQKGIAVKEIIIAVDALSVIINASNPLNQLPMDKIGAIFRGEITNWKQVGGPDKVITLYGRQSNSGTFSFFREHVLKGEYSDKMLQMNGNSQIVEAVRHDSAAIGYVGVAYAAENDKPLRGLKILNVSAKQGDIAYSPLVEANIISNKYPVSRGLNQYISAKSGKTVQDFINFELSVQGQKIVTGEGFYGVKDQQK